MNTNMKILVVDDFSTMRRIIRNLLGDLGFSSANIRDAEGAKQALKTLHGLPIDLVITDWNMPDMTGMDLLRAIRADEDLRNMPVLMVTAENDRSQIVEAAGAGVNGYIVKPFTTGTLEKKINRIFQRLETAHA